MWTVGALVLLTIAVGTISAVTDKVVCYYGSWSIYRPSNGYFNVDNIDPTLCTHAIYTFIGLNEDASIQILDSYNDLDLDGYKKFNLLKTKNKNLKTLIAIGGWNEGSIKYSKVASSAALRQKFVKNVVKFVKKYEFDGFDLDWEYPAQRGGAKTDKVNHSKLLRELRVEFDKHGLLLTAAVAAAATSVDKSYDVPALSQNLDLINLMAYDLHGPWEQVTGINAPLQPASTDITPAQRELNVVACIKAWIDRGAAPEKIMLGVGTYGRTFTLNNVSNNQIGAPANAPGMPGQYTGESGMLGYNEICEKLKSEKWNVVWNAEQKVPYAYKGNQWVGYDNPRSIGIKVAYAKHMRLGGIMIWSVETDDFRGICGPKYPLLNAIKSGIQGNSSEENFPTTTVSEGLTTITSATATSTIEPSYTTTTSVIDGTEFKCKQSGYARDPIDCSKFYYCHPTGHTFIKYSYKCSEGLYYDPVKYVCDYKENVQC